MKHLFKQHREAINSAFVFIGGPANSFANHSAEANESENKNNEVNETTKQSQEARERVNAETISRVVESLSQDYTEGELEKFPEGKNGERILGVNDNCAVILDESGKTSIIYFGTGNVLYKISKDLNAEGGDFSVNAEDLKNGEKLNPTNADYHTEMDNFKAYQTLNCGGSCNMEKVTVTEAEMGANGFEKTITHTKNSEYLFASDAGEEVQKYVRICVYTVTEGNRDVQYIFDADTGDLMEPHKSRTRYSVDGLVRIDTESAYAAERKYVNLEKFIENIGDDIVKTETIVASKNSYLDQVSKNLGVPLVSGETQLWYQDSDGGVAEVTYELGKKLGEMKCNGEACAEFGKTNADLILPGQHIYKVDGKTLAIGPKNGKKIKTLNRKVETTETVTDYKLVIDGKPLDQASAETVLETYDGGIEAVLKPYIESLNTILSLSKGRLKLKEISDFVENGKFKDGMYKEFSQLVKDSGKPLKLTKTTTKKVNFEDAKNIDNAVDVNGIGTQDKREYRLNDSLQDAKAGLEYLDDMQKKLFLEQNGKARHALANRVQQAVNEGGGVLSMKDGLLGAVAGITNDILGGNWGGEHLWKSLMKAENLTKEEAQEKAAAIESKVAADTQKLSALMTNDLKGVPSEFWQDAANVLSVLNRYSALVTSIFTPMIHLANIKVKKQAHRVNWDNYLESESYSGARKMSVENVDKYRTNLDNANKNIEGLEYEVDQDLLDTLGYSIDQSGNIYEDRAKAHQRLAFSFRERIWNKDNRAIRKARRVLRQSTEGMDSAEKLQVNRDKVTAMKEIQDVLKAENAADLFDKKAQKIIGKDVLIALSEELYRADSRAHAPAVAKMLHGLTLEQRQALDISSQDLVDLEANENNATADFQEHQRKIMNKVLKHRFIKKSEHLTKNDRLDGRKSMIKAMNSNTDHLGDMSDNQSALEARKLVEKIGDSDTGLKAEKAFAVLEKKLEGIDLSIMSDIDKQNTASKIVGHMFDSYNIVGLEAVKVQTDLTEYFYAENAEDRVKKLAELMEDDNFVSVVNVMIGNVEKRNSLDGLDENCLADCLLKIKERSYSSEDIVIKRKGSIPIVIPVELLMESVQQVTTQEETVVNGFNITDKGVTTFYESEAAAIADIIKNNTGITEDIATQIFENIAVEGTQTFVTEGTKEVIKTSAGTLIDSYGNKIKDIALDTSLRGVEKALGVAAINITANQLVENIENADSYAQARESVVKNNALMEHFPSVDRELSYEEQVRQIQEIIGTKADGKPGTKTVNKLRSYIEKNTEKLSLSKKFHETFNEFLGGTLNIQVALPVFMNNLSQEELDNVKTYLDSKDRLGQFEQLVKDELIARNYKAFKSTT